jgi:hypothetical protein
MAPPVGSVWLSLLPSMPPGLGSQGVAVGSFLPALALIAAVVVHRWWPYLLLAGAGMALAAVLRAGSVGPPSLSTGYLGVVAVPFVFVGVLAAAQSLVQLGRAALGSALAATVVGSGLVGTALIGTPFFGAWRQPARLDVVSWHVGLAALSVVGALTLVVRHGLSRPDASRGPAGATGSVPQWSNRRLLVVGVLAACFGFLPQSATMIRILRLMSPNGVNSFQDIETLVTVVGVVTFVIGLVLAAVLGKSSVAAGLTAATVQVAAVGPTTYAMLSLSPVVVPDNPGLLGAAAALLGVGAGIFLASRLARVVLAGICAGLCAVVLVVVAGHSSGRLAQVPATALLILLIATTMAGFASAAPALARSGALPVVLGPVLAAIMTGEALTVGATEAGWGSGYGFGSTTILEVSVALFAVAAFMIGLGRRALEVGAADDDDDDDDDYDDDDDEMTWTHDATNR